MAGNRKSNVGRVVSDKMNKTVVVAVERYQVHRLYKRRIKRVSRFKAHDEGNKCRLGDTVRIAETRPLSKEKRWRVVEILGRIEIAETQPMEIDQEIVAEPSQ
ncbi:MAG: 30S ribosomal protein S17 [Dehalococcoidia bacterium]